MTSFFTHHGLPLLFAAVAVDDDGGRGSGCSATTAFSHAQVAGDCRPLPAPLALPPHRPVRWVRRGLGVALPMFHRLLTGV